ncbi:AFR458Cp [Eremothecium gossypii ATCC 10895]|uniref:AFR458Cp n=1 Tax=Eremothecium gossypii (strain ATCC 10895 / CBS 109.51 / FGSC 9923 / NRRL Y-1056) TaxID=284811 RepID=Q752W5_EREGS|nr:AFR458Cp [Eremothecium gossypii ATCC 10895]AAS53829.1 AFR458Cp [Eremothecium gossypii ATCC 10895]AEY98141.1 FAFR458Cp [Eremothecium gossypii FDAG1]
MGSGVTVLSADITQLTEEQVNAGPDGAVGTLLKEAYQSAVWGGEGREQQRCQAVNRKLLFQVCMVENVSRSRLAQVDEYHVRLAPRKQMVDRVGAGKELVSSVDVDSDSNQPAADERQAPAVYKLTLQDKSGGLFYAMNVEAIGALKTVMLGAKLVILPGAVFNRGIFLLTASTVRLLFGLIPSWNGGKEHKVCAYLECLLEEERVATGSGKRKR